MDGLTASALVAENHSPPPTDQSVLSHMQTCAAGQQDVELFDRAVRVLSLFNLVEKTPMIP